MNKKPVAAKSKGRSLLFPDINYQIVLPFGVGVTTENSSFELRKTKMGMTVIARRKNDLVHATQISPTYSTIDRIRVADGKRPVPMRFWVAQSDLDRLRARQLIEREHYLMPNSRGLFLVCGFEDGARDSKPKIIGVAVLDALFHGNPKQGRALFATEALGSQNWLNWPRNKIVNRLRIAWASRFAVESRYHNCGIGTRLALHLKVVARRFRSPGADFIEVITTEPQPTKRAILKQVGNFLLRAGYTRLEQPMKSSPLRRLNLKTGYLDGVPARKYYYYADLRK
ncbi:MAG: hypothetical protein WB987_01640 [Candidatus Acidiferrales bacterium]